MSDIGRDDDGKFRAGNEHQFKRDDPRINREGRPKRPSLTAELVRRMSDGEDGKELVEDLIEKGINEALGGNFQYWRELWLRMDGREPDRISGHDGGPIFDEEALARIKKLVDAARSVGD